MIHLPSMFRQLLALCTMIVVGLMTVASALPVPDCEYRQRVTECPTMPDCDCNSDLAPPPVCCLGLSEMPEMLLPHEAQSPRPIMPWTEEQYGAEIAGLDECSSMFAEPLVRESMSLLYLLYQVILC